MSANRVDGGEGSVVVIVANEIDSVIEDGVVYLLLVLFTFCLCCLPFVGFAYLLLVLFTFCWFCLPFVGVVYLLLFTFCWCCLPIVGVVYLLYMLYFKMSCVYCCHLMCICCTVCALLFLLYMPDCWLEVSIWKVLRPTTSIQVFLGFPVSISKC